MSRSCRWQGRRLLFSIPITRSRSRSNASALPRTPSSIHYFYVVDEQETLVGVVPTRVLLSAAPEQLVRDVMITHVVAIPDWATVLIASEYFATRRLLAFPVVNDAGQLRGVVDVGLFTDEVIDLAKQTYDDIFQLIGVHGTAQSSTWVAFRDRFPWLLCNIAGGLLAAFIASRFEHLLQEVVVLSLFIPIVLALGESVSMQALTLTLQSLADGPIVWSRLFSALWKEFRTAMLLGLACGGVVGLVVLALARADAGRRVDLPGDFDVDGGRVPAWCGAAVRAARRQGRSENCGGTRGAGRRRCRHAPAVLRPRREAARLAIAREGGFQLFCRHPPPLSWRKRDPTRVRRTEHGGVR